MDINETISRITINVNSISMPIKRQRFSEWIEKTQSKYILSITNGPFF